MPFRNSHDHAAADGGWAPIGWAQFAAFTIGLGMFVVIVLRSETGWFWLVDGADLLFHEAGHMVFGVLGPTVGLYGGTLGQLVFPVVVIISFWWQGAPVSYAVGWIWLFENFFNVARYMADARAQKLPLVGGGEHDWFNIFLRWHALPYDTTIAMIVRIGGWVGIAAVWLWVAWRALASKRA